MNLQWLTKRVTADELRADPNGPVLWKTLLDQYRDGDELWEFNSGPESWQHLAGRCGVTLVRHGEIVASEVTMMN